MYNQIDQVQTTRLKNEELSRTHVVQQAEPKSRQVPHCSLEDETGVLERGDYESPAMPPERFADEKCR
jgi:hypothetical protein